MFACRNHKHAYSLTSAAIAVSLAGLFATPLAFSRVAMNTIDAIAIVTDDGRHLVVTGPIACTANERAYLRVTVTQRATGALAEGHTLVDCTGNIEHWEIHAAIQGNETFQPGSATAVASARTSFRDSTSDAHQWLVAITLVSE